MKCPSRAMQNSDWQVPALVLIANESQKGASARERAPQAGSAARRADRRLSYPEQANAWSLAITINDLPEGGTAHIISISAAAPELAAKLREIGFCEGDEVQLLTRGPLGAQPLAVRLSRRVIAMRIDGARAIEVEL